jgi:hypothetical protein
MIQIHFSVLAMLLFASFAWADDAKPADKPADTALKSPAEPKPDPAKQSAEEIERQLKERLNKKDPDAKAPAGATPPTAEKPAAGDKPATTPPATIAPTTAPPTPDVAAPRFPSPAARIDQPDPRIVGTAPGLPAPTLRREGEFVLQRRGRLIRSEGAQPMFSFDADGPKAAEAPMYLLPCRLLQNMEELVREQGDQTVFILTGQVFVYRGANYLLPTLIKPAVEKGNLKK